MENSHSSKILLKMADAGVHPPHHLLPSLDPSLGLNSGPVKLDVVLQTARHRWDVSSEQRWPDPRLQKRTRHSFHVSTLYRECNEDLI